MRLPNSIKTLYLAKNNIDGILQPRYLNFLDNLANIDLAKNPFLNKLQNICLIDPKIFIYFLLGNNIKKINNSKITPEDIE
jgi:hypothetical protein